MAIRRAPGALLVLTFGLALAGCLNPFQPAKPEPPRGTVLTVNHSNPDTLMTSIMIAIDARSDAGRAAYLDALADSTDASTFGFVALLSAPVVTSWSGALPGTWNKALESRLYEYLQSTLYPGYYFDFLWLTDEDEPTDIEMTDETAGLAIRRRRYELVATSPTSGDTRTVAVGFADLYFQKVNSKWFIYRWDDRYDPRIGVVPTQDPDQRSMTYRRLDSNGSAH